jgi:hypothetical protein
VKMEAWEWRRGNLLACVVRVGAREAVTVGLPEGPTQAQHHAREGGGVGLGEQEEEEGGLPGGGGGDKREVPSPCGMGGGLSGGAVAGVEVLDGVGANLAERARPGVGVGGATGDHEGPPASPSVLGGEGVDVAPEGSLVDVGPELALGVGPGQPQAGGVVGGGGLGEARYFPEVVVGKVLPVPDGEGGLVHLGGEPEGLPVGGPVGPVGHELQGCGLNAVGDPHGGMGELRNGGGVASVEHGRVAVTVGEQADVGGPEVAQRELVARLVGAGQQKDVGVGLLPGDEGADGQLAEERADLLGNHKVTAEEREEGEDVDVEDHDLLREGEVTDDVVEPLKALHGLVIDGPEDLSAGDLPPVENPQVLLLLGEFDVFPPGGGLEKGRLGLGGGKGGGCRGVAP